MNCNFKNFFDSKDCEGAVYPIIEDTLCDKILSHVGLILGPITTKYSICDFHKSIIYKKIKCTDKSVLCCVPPMLAIHTEKVPRGDRRLSADLVMKIHQNTGLVLPVGAGK